mgnify:CR=1 FL=1
MIYNLSYTFIRQRQFPNDYKLDIRDKLSTSTLTSVQLNFKHIRPMIVCVKHFSSISKVSLDESICVFILTPSSFTHTHTRSKLSGVIQTKVYSKYNVLCIWKLFYN